MVKAAWGVYSLFVIRHDRFNVPAQSVLARNSSMTCSWTVSCLQWEALTCLLFTQVSLFVLLFTLTGSAHASVHTAPDERAIVTAEYWCSSRDAHLSIMSSALFLFSKVCHFYFYSCSLSQQRFKTQNQILEESFRFF